MLGYKDVSVVMVIPYDTGKPEVVMTFNKVITENDYWDILGSYTHDFPLWLNRDFLKNKSLVDHETNDVYILDTSKMLSFNSVI